MSTTLFTATGVRAAIGALKKDLIGEDGPQISTMRNYRFAIVAYDPRKEFELRQHTVTLAEDLRTSGWVVHSIDLNRLLMQRLERELGDDLPRLIEAERRLAGKDPKRGLRLVTDKLARIVEGPEGLAGDVVAEIDRFVQDRPHEVDRTLVLVGRAGVLYPYFRVSALLRFLDGRTHRIPVVLLYPGEHQGETGLSFMGELEATHDYRPRIYS